MDEMIAHQGETMKLKLTCTWVVFLVIGLMSTQVSADHSPVLKTQKDMQSYAVGVELVRNYKRQGADLDLDIVMRGMKEALAGDKLLLTEEDLLTSLSMFTSELRRKKAGDRLMAQQDNKKNGEAFLAENKTKPGVVTLPSGLQYKILKAGEGKKPTDADTIECRFRGSRIDGTDLENPSERLDTFKISAVIPGWREAIKLMSVGSKWQLFIPPQLGYGQRGSGHIGPYETLIYEIELIEIK
jgi:FKBP-type peptidyl-prolyl cis-trans isomerase